jgi:hypothetical protein
MLMKPLKLRSKRALVLQNFFKQIIERFSHKFAPRWVLILDQAPYGLYMTFIGQRFVYAKLVAKIGFSGGLMLGKLS